MRTKSILRRASEATKFNKVERRRRHVRSLNQIIKEVQKPLIRVAKQNRDIGTKRIPKRVKIAARSLCIQRKAETRRAYFAFVASGNGTARPRKKHDNRFTVSC